MISLIGNVIETCNVFCSLCSRYKICASRWRSNQQKGPKCYGSYDESLDLTGNWKQSFEEISLLLCAVRVNPEHAGNILQWGAHLHEYIS